MMFCLLATQENSFFCSSLALLSDRAPRRGGGGTQFCSQVKQGGRPSRPVRRSKTKMFANVSYAGGVSYAHGRISASSITE